VLVSASTRRGPSAKGNISLSETRYEDSPGYFTFAPLLGWAFVNNRLDNVTFGLGFSGEFDDLGKGTWNCVIGQFGNDPRLVKDQSRTGNSPCPWFWDASGLSTPLKHQRNQNRRRRAYPRRAC
jgi:hypothetical protein